MHRYHGPERSFQKNMDDIHLIPPTAYIMYLVKPLSAHFLILFTTLSHCRTNRSSACFYVHLAHFPHKYPPLPHYSVYVQNTFVISFNGFLFLHIRFKLFQHQFFSVMSPVQEPSFFFPSVQLKLLNPVFSFSLSITRKYDNTS